MQPTTTASLSDQIRAAVRRSGLTQTEICRRADGKVDQASLSRFLSGQRIGLKKLDPLAAAVGIRVSADDLDAAHDGDVMQALAGLFTAVSRQARQLDRQPTAPSTTERAKVDRGEPCPA